MKHIMIAAIIAAGVSALAPPGRADSLWPADRAASAYRDQRARAVGDLLTVIVVQSSVASHEAASETDKRTSASADHGTGLLKFFPDFGFGAERTTSGSGSTTSKTQFADRMTVKVTEVLDNGAVRIEGLRSTVINAEKMELRLTGVVRAQDIAPDNTVLSTFIADQQLEFTGKGPIAEKQRPGLISRLLHFLF
jgi:flagellar L-ring protein precursor FlgH